MVQPARLFQPGNIGKMAIRNRIIMAAMGTYAAGFDGTMTDRLVDYYVARAKGGVGLIITQLTTVTASARMPHMLSMYDDKYIPGQAKLTRAVQEHGAKIACQLGHIGIGLPHIWKDYRQPEDIEVVGPSAVPCISFGVTPRDISREEIKSLVEDHAETARRAVDAGFDAVELHGAHGYFLSAFFSPYKNRRQDEYGGSLENRARFACEIISRIKQRVGADFPVIVRINGSDFVEGGITLEDAVRQAPLLVEAGADALNISAGAPEGREWRDLSYMFPDGAIVHLAEAVKKRVNVPVITVGKIADPQFIERILEEKKADFVAIGRPLLADPELSNKTREGRFEDIRRCIYCNNCRLGVFSKQRFQTRGAGLGCTVNPMLLREREFAIRPTPNPKKVMVVGGGLAGMEAARVLAERGHRVTLYEKDSKLGGQWNIAATHPEKNHFSTTTEYLSRGLNKADVKISFNTEVTRHLVEEEKPDAVVLATGATPVILNVPGTQGRNVVQALDVFTGQAHVGDNVVIVGGRLRGMEVANILAGQGKKVCLVTKMRLGENGTPLERNIFFVLRQKLIEKGVLIYANAPILEISDKGVYLAQEGELIFLIADTVVLAVGARADNRLARELEGVVSELYSIGDCAQPRNARDAINEGAEIARRI